MTAGVPIELVTRYEVTMALLFNGEEYDPKSPDPERRMLPEGVGFPEVRWLLEIGRVVERQVPRLVATANAGSEGTEDERHPDDTPGGSGAGDTPGAGNAPRRGGRGGGGNPDGAE